MHILPVNVPLFHFSTTLKLFATLARILLPCEYLKSGMGDKEFKNLSLEKGGD